MHINFLPSNLFIPALTSFQLSHHRKSELLDSVAVGSDGVVGTVDTPVQYNRVKPLLFYDASMLIPL